MPSYVAFQGKSRQAYFHLITKTSEKQANKNGDKFDKVELKKYESVPRVNRLPAN